MSRKVILLGPTPPPYGGVSVYMATLFQHLRGDGVQLWTFGDRRATESNVSVFNQRRFGLVPLLLREGCRARIVDSTHFHIEYPNPALVPLWVVLKMLLGFEWVKIIHDGSLPSRYGRFSLLEKFLFRLAASSVTEFISVSEELRLWLLHEMGVRQKVTTVPSLLPSAPEAADAALTPETEKALSRYMQYRKRLCSTGVFIPSYGFKHVAETVEQVRLETGEDVGLILLNGTFAGDESYRSEVLRGRDWISVLENVPNSQVYAIMKRSDVFVRSVAHEGYGLSRVEALWCGLPVVATEAGETRGMMVYKFRDKEALTRQLKRALFDAPADEVHKWAEFFRREAERNLQALRDAIASG